MMSGFGVPEILTILSAAAGLGAAAMGLVDASKAVLGGPSNFGFGQIIDGISPFLPHNNTVFGRAKVLETLKANWLNGVSKADQKSKAKALVHLGLGHDTAAQLAKVAGVDAGVMQSLATNIANGIAPLPAQLNVLGQFDVVLSAALDTAYERGDQKYRNACKLLAMAIATVLAVLGGYLLPTPEGVDAANYFGSSKLAIAVLIGLSAAPLAPVSKDLATSLQAAVGAIRATRV